ncbi:MAG TPA: FAD binding domain-containing protein [Alphaproteobacteria bacterium]|nr:FAD binding domain-containing protein [Alphaproteobacteria bacterium]
MKPVSFDYQRPETLERAVSLLADANGEARPLAGGQTLGPMLNLRLVMPVLLVDIGRLPALRRIEDRGDRLILGAGVTHATIEDRADSSPLGKLLSHVAGTIAYRAIRNRGTIGGSLSHADPAADWITAMTLLGADVIIASAKGKQRIAMASFMRGAFATTTAPGELLEAIEIPKLSSGARWGYYKVCRKTGEFPDAIGAALFDPDRGMSRVIAGALDGAPMALPSLAEQIARESVGAASAERVGAAVAEAAPHLDPVDHQLHAAAVRRAILQAYAR